MKYWRTYVFTDALLPSLYTKADTLFVYSARVAPKIDRKCNAPVFPPKIKNSNRSLRSCHVFKCPAEGSKGSHPPETGLVGSTSWNIAALCWQLQRPRKKKESSSPRLLPTRHSRSRDRFKLDYLRRLCRNYTDWCSNKFDCELCEAQVRPGI